MKKTYSKPSLRIESFSFSQSIANGCGSQPMGGMPTVAGDGSCGWEIGGSVFFNDGIAACAQGELPGLCYNAPQEGMAVFQVS